MARLGIDKFMLAMFALALLAVAAATAQTVRYLHPQRAPDCSTLERRLVAYRHCLQLGGRCEKMSVDDFTEYYDIKHELENCPKENAAE